MRRREFIAGLALPLLTARSWAQQPNKIYRIAVVLRKALLDPGNSYYRAFFRELRALGYVEGTNLVVLQRSDDRTREIGRELIELRPDVIFTTWLTLLQFLKDAASTIPIVAIIYDPVSYGYAATLARPGGNVTGVSMDAGLEIYGKYLEILKSIHPKMSKLALLATWPHWSPPIYPALLREAQRVGVSIVGQRLEYPVDEAKYKQIVATFAKNEADAMFVAADSDNVVHARFIIGLAELHRLPALYAVSNAAQQGGLVSYVIDLVEVSTIAARYVARILNGEKPAELPFQQPTKWQLSINLKTAKALGLTIPDSLLARADEVIE
jgi:putative tryptophan/tyrosine transport system substrate-binding protein